MSEIESNINNTNQKTTKSNWLPVLVFFVLSYILFWGIGYLLFITLGDTSVLINFSSFMGILYYIIALVPAFSPFIAALVVTAIFEKKKGLKQFSKRLFNFKVKIHWYIIAFLIPIIVYLSLKVIRYIINLPSSAPFMERSAWNLGLLLSLNIVFSGIAEEPGWRNYAVPKMNKIFNPLVTSVIIGILWACWHLTFYIYGARSWSQFPQFLFTVVMLSIIYTWLYIKTESAPVVMLFHIVHNFAVFLFLDVEITFWSGGGIVYAIIALIIIIFYGPSLKERKSIKEIFSRSRKVEEIENKKIEEDISS
jgi:membrane protease YdiL (CAAX protease family)